jgi:autotransporter-associated beta strand protein
MSPPLHLGTAALASALLFSSPAIAADGFWTGERSGSWEDTANWNAATLATGVEAEAAFKNIDLTGNITVTLDGPKSVGGLTFGDITPSHDWFLRTGTGGPLTLDAGLSSPLITVINQTATLGLPLAGTSGFTKDGAGTLVLSAASTYSGPTTISQGTLRLASPPVFPAGMKIMPLGDSITFGDFGFNAGYRGPLYYLLSPTVPNYRYVGSSIQKPGLLPFEQRYHEGHSSYTIQDTSNNLDGFDNARFLQYGGAERNPNGGHWLTGGNDTGRAPLFPDVITLMLGTNDLPDQTGVEARLTALLEKITTLRPNAALLVARITPVPSHPEVNPYNLIVSSTVEAFRSAGKNVHLVDLNTHFPPNGLSPDGVHPNEIGFNWMAIQWYEALITAHTQPGGSTPALPSTSSITVASGAVLDLDGCSATVAALNHSGTLELGNAGQLTAAAIRLQHTGTIGGSGTLHGPIIYNGPDLGTSGQQLTFTGTFTNNGRIGTAAGAALHFGNDLINNGTLIIGDAQPLEFSGTVVNNGVIRATGGTPLLMTGLINNGVLDLITGPQTLPSGFVNHGLVLDSSEVKIHTAAATGDHFSVSIRSHSGHFYQLQHSPTLDPAAWQNTGSAQPGDTGALLHFSVPRDPGTPAGFYRIAVSP